MRRVRRAAVSKVWVGRLAPLHSNTAMPTPHPGSHADSYAHILISSYAHILTSSYAHTLICSYPHILSLSLSQPTGWPAGQPASRAPLGAKCAFGAAKAPMLEIFGDPSFSSIQHLPRARSLGPEVHLLLQNAFRAPKRVLGLQKHQKTSYTYEKVRLGRFGSAKALQNAKDATLRF